MRLRVVIPTEVAFDEEVDAVVGPGVFGSSGVDGGGGGAFGLLPHHVDTIQALAPGLLGLRQQGRERFLGVDGGILIKRGPLVQVATPRATAPADLGAVRAEVEAAFLRRSAGELAVRRALDQLEARVVRGVLAMEARRGR